MDHRGRPQSGVQSACPTARHALLSSREGGSEKHLRDIRSLLAVSREQIDFTQLNEWLQRLGLEAECQRVSPKTAQHYGEFEFLVVTRLFFRGGLTRRRRIQDSVPKTPRINPERLKSTSRAGQ